MATERKHQIDLGANAFDQPTNFCKIRRSVEVTVARANQVDLGLRTVFPLGCRHLLAAVFVPQPGQGAIGALPLVFVDCARQKSLDIGAFRRHAAANHLRNRSCNHDAGLVVGKGRVRALHGTFRAVLPQFLFAEPGHNDWQLVRRQAIGVVQHRGDRQVLAADWTVDNDLQALDRSEHVNRAPVAAGSIVIHDQHQIGSSTGFCLASWRR